MSDHPRFTLNRSVVLLRYRQPFLDWFNATGQGTNPPTLEEMNREDSEIFLIPDDQCLAEPVESGEDAGRWVEKRWRMFFEYMLGSWVTDESLWPQKLTLKMFRDWFAVEYHSMVWDMGSEALVVEDWDDEEEDTEGSSTLH